MRALVTTIPGTINRSRGDQNESHESRQLVLEEKRADQVDQDQGTLALLLQR